MASPRIEIRVNRIDGKDVQEWRWICSCGLDGEWRAGPAPAIWDLSLVIISEHMDRYAEKIANN